MSSSPQRILELSNYGHLRKASTFSQDTHPVNSSPVINFKDRSGPIQDRKKFEGEREIFANMEAGLDPTKANAHETLKVFRDKALYLGVSVTVIILDTSRRILITGDETDVQLGNILRGSKEQKDPTIARKLGGHLLSLVE